MGRPRLRRSQGANGPACGDALVLMRRRDARHAEPPQGRPQVLPRAATVPTVTPTSSSYMAVSSPHVVPKVVHRGRTLTHTLFT